MTRSLQFADGKLSPRPEPLPTPSASPEPEPAAIRLSPSDWMMATWRPYTPLPKPNPAPFDREAAMAVIDRWVAIAQKKHWGWWGMSAWGNVELPSRMSPEEARFWLQAIPILAAHFSGKQPGTRTPAELLADVDITSAPSPKEAAALLDGGLNSLLTIVLLNL